MNKHQSSYPMMQWTSFTLRWSDCFLGSLPRSRTMGPKSMCILWLVIYSPTLSPEGCPCAPPTSAPEEASFQALANSRHVPSLLNLLNLRDAKWYSVLSLHFLFSGEWKHFFPMCFLAILILSTTNCLFIYFAYYFSRIFFLFNLSKKVYLAIFSIPYFRMRFMSS